jgi:hypothetical protein
MSSDDGFVKVVDLLSRPAFRAMLRVEAPTSEEALEMAKSALGDSVLLELQKEGTADMGVRRRSLEGRVVRQVGPVPRFSFSGSPTTTTTMYSRNPSSPISIV